MRGNVPDSCGLACITASIASSMSAPIDFSASIDGPSPFAFSARKPHRACAGTQNTPRPVYSSVSSMSSAIWSSSYPSAASSVRIPARRSSKASETYFRNTRPRMTSLYWEASIEPRSLSAAFQSVSFSSFMVDGAGAAFGVRGMDVPYCVSAASAAWSTSIMVTAPDVAPATIRAA
jgi:hypothetical protein